jgi:hypothetical protein
VELNIEQFKEITTKPCHYCDRLTKNLYEAYLREFIDVKKDPRRLKTLLGNGIDRKNNNMGYTIENSLSCCAKCNFMKGKLSYEEFIEQIVTIRNNIVNKHLGE